MVQVQSLPEPARAIGGDDGKMQQQQAGEVAQEQRFLVRWFDCEVPGEAEVRDIPPSGVSLDSRFLDFKSGRSKRLRAHLRLA